MADVSRPSTTDEFVQDVDGRFSSKRLAMFALLGAYLLGGVAGTMHLAVPVEFMDGLKQLLLGNLAVVVAERYSPERKSDVA